MPPVVIKWRIFCITEDAWSYGYLDEGVPCTVCFNNNEHTVNLDSPQQLNIISPITTIISTQTPGETNGNLRIEGFKFTAAANTTTNNTISFPLQINILAIRVDISPSNVGDELNVFVMPQSNTGILAATVNSATTTITLPVAFIAFLQPGFQIIFTKADASVTETSSDIISINTIANTVTLVSGLSNTFNSGDYINFCFQRIRNLHMAVSSSNWGIGNFLRGSLFRLGFKAVVKYTNTDLLLPKTFSYGVTYLL